MSANKNDCYAFPQPMVDNQGRIDHAADYGNAGMTLRDYFATKAMQGALASCPHGMRFEKSVKLPLADWASTSYAMADAMLAERSKT